MGCFVFAASGVLLDDVVGDEGELVSDRFVIVATDVEDQRGIVHRTGPLDYPGFIEVLQTRWDTEGRSRDSDTSSSRWVGATVSTSS